MIAGIIYADIHLHQKIYRRLMRHFKQFWHNVDLRALQKLTVVITPKLCIFVHHGVLCGSIISYKRSHSYIFYTQVVVYFRNGEDWLRQRKPISKFTMVPQRVAGYWKDFNLITLDFLDIIRRDRHKITMQICDISPYIFRWSFESKLF